EAPLQHLTSGRQDLSVCEANARRAVSAGVCHQATEEGWKRLLRTLLPGESRVPDCRLDPPQFFGAVMQCGFKPNASQAMPAVLHRKVPGAMRCRADDAGDLSGSGARCEAVPRWRAGGVGEVPARAHGEGGGSP